MDAQARVIAAALIPAAALSRRLGLSLDEFQRIASEAYFLELRERGLSLRGIARRTGKSLRTIATLAKRVSESTDPRPETQLDLHRRVVAHIASHGPMRLEALGARFPRVPVPTLSHELSWLVARRVLVLEEGSLSRRGTAKGLRFSQAQGVC